MLIAPFVIAAATLACVAPEPPAPAAPPAAPPATPPPAQPAPEKPAAPAASAQPSPAQIMDEVEKARPKDAPAPAATPAPEGERKDGSEARTASGRLLREGSFIANRKGRMVRASSGDWAMTFDADATGPADPPMILMPCLNLMSMEKIAERAGDTLTFTVSGQVFVYKGKNYLLPSMYVINRAGDLVGVK